MWEPHVTTPSCLKLLHILCLRRLSDTAVQTQAHILFLLENVTASYTSPLPPCLLPQSVLRTPPRCSFQNASRIQTALRHRQQYSQNCLAQHLRSLLSWSCPSLSSISWVWSADDQKPRDSNRHIHMQWFLGSVREGNAGLDGVSPSISQSLFNANKFQISKRV